MRTQTPIIVTSDGVLNVVKNYVKNGMMICYMLKVTRYIIQIAAKNTPKRTVLIITPIFVSV
jgi:hypothetical protein